MIDWRNFCRGVEGFSVDGEAVEVATSEARRHRILIRETTDSFDLTGIVARASAVAAIRDISLRTWRQNRAAQLLGFRIDHKGRLVGESWVPKAGLTRDEFLFYVKRVAAECDLFEYHLTGEDRE